MPLCSLTGDVTAFIVLAHEQSPLSLNPRQPLLTVASAAVGPWDTPSEGLPGPCRLQCS
jgi:hypothetical protein